MTLWRRSLQLVVVCCLLGFGTSVGKDSAQSSEPAPEKHSPGRHIVAEGLSNFGEVTPELYRGGQPTAVGFERLARMGVGIVVDFGRSARDERQTTKLGLQYVTIPWHCPFPRDRAFAQFLKLIQENPEKKIFAHCRLGDDRTGMMIAAYRMGLQGWSADEAMKEMKNFGFSRSHHFICPGLATYEQNFPEHFKKADAFAAIRARKASRRSGQTGKE